MNQRYVALLSGEHPELGYAELESILTVLSRGSRYSISKLTDRIISVEVDESTAREICNRAGYVKAVIRPFLHAKLCDVGTEQDLDMDVISSLVSPFAVRASVLGRSEVGSMTIERWVGGLVKRACPWASVNLNRPSTMVCAYVDGEEVVAGILLGALDSKGFEARRPGRRPFNHPSAIQPKLARCMVNLAQAKIGEYILDPFAGTGSIPLEAYLLGYRPIAVEIRRWIARGCYANVLNYMAHSDVITGDAKRLMIRRVISGVVTDPPYGKSTYVPDGEAIRLIEVFASSVCEVMLPGSRLVIASPVEFMLEDILYEQGFTVIRSFDYRVHSKLTRRVSVASVP